VKKYEKKNKLKQTKSQCALSSVPVQDPWRQWYLRLSSVNQVFTKYIYVWRYGVTECRSAQRVGSAASEVRVDSRQETAHRPAVVSRRDRTSPSRAGHEHVWTCRRQIPV